MRLCVILATIRRHAYQFTEGHAGWLVLQERCLSCGWEQVAIAPAEAPKMGLECSRCHQMACVSSLCWTR